MLTNLEIQHNTALYLYFISNFHHLENSAPLTQNIFNH